MSRRRVCAPLVCLVLAMLSWPATSSAQEIFTSASVSAKVTELRGGDLWVVKFTWTANCTGAAPGTAWYEGRLQLIDVETEERIDAGEVVDTSGSASVSGERDWYVPAKKRPQRLLPELTIHCYENFPLKRGTDARATGNIVIIPPIFASRGGGAGGGRDGGGHADPTRSLGAGGCKLAVLGTNGPDKLEGADAGDVMVGFAARDRLKGRSGHDCLIGGSGGDRLEGEGGDDRLTGGAGADRLVDDKGTNAFDAGPGSDFVDARNGQRETVRCGSGHDLVRADKRDRLRGCERRLR